MLERASGLRMSMRYPPEIMLEKPKQWLIPGSDVLVVDLHLKTNIVLQLAIATEVVLPV